MKKIFLLFSAFLLLLPLFCFAESSPEATGINARIFCPRHLDIGNPYLIMANIILGMLAMVAFHSLFTGIRSKERTYLFLGLFYIGAFINAVSNLYTFFVISTVEPYIGSWVMIASSVAFFVVYLNKPLSRVEKSAVRVILGTSLMFFILSILQEILSDTKWIRLNVMMDLVIALIMAVLLLWLINLSFRGNKRGRDLLFFECIIVLGGLSALGILKRSVEDLSLVPSEVLDANFIFLIGMTVNGFLFTHLLSRGYVRLKVDQALAERENEKLKELDQVKTDLMMNVSHEFKTPITVIGGIVRQLKEGRWGNSIQANLRQLEIIERNNLRLEKQVSNLLELSRLEQNRLEPKMESLDLKRVLTTICSEFHSLAEQQNLQLTMDVHEGLEIYADPMLFDTAVLNLLSNAIRHTPAGGTIEVSACRDGASVSISVADTGEGIPEEVQDAVFDRFYQVKLSGGAPFRGTGIGLSLVQEIMAIHDGTVTLNSRLDDGTIFRLVFPVNVDSSDSPMRKKTIVSSDRKRQIAGYLADFNPPCDVVSGITSGIRDLRSREKLPALLLVEDNQDLAEYLRIELEPYFRVTVAGDGITALERISIETPDAIISDVMMPRLDGHSLFERLSRDNRTRFIPFLFLTARSDRSEKTAALKKGAVEYIEKPFRMDELIAKTETLIRSSHEKMDYYSEGLKRALTDFIKSYGTGDVAVPSSFFHNLCESAGLSPREFEITKLLRRGFSDKEIAAELDLSVKTVGNHNTSVFRKLGVTGRLELLSMERN